MRSSLLRTVLRSCIILQQTLQIRKGEWDKFGNEDGFEMKFGRLFCIGRKGRSGVERTGRSLWN